MENNFDKAIKKALENFEADYKPSDWSLMEQKIEAQDGLNTDVEDVYLDGMVYDSLHNLDTAYNPAHWDLMKEKLDDPYALRRRLMKYKVAEIALVALFIFTLVQFLPFNKIQKRTHTPANSIATIETATSEKSNVDLTIPATVQNKQNNLNNNSDKVAQDNSPSNEHGSATSTPQNEAQALNKTTSTVPSGISISKNETLITETTETSKTLEATLDPETVIADSPATVSASIAEADAPFTNTNLLSPILLKEADQLSIPGIEEISSSTVFSDLKQPIKVRIGMTLGPDANYVMTPVDQDNNYEAFDQVAAGYTGGFILGFKYNRFEIETGALYSAVTYGSRNIFEIKGSFAEGGYVRQGLAGAELDLIRLPLNLKYNFFEKKKWNIYALSGASLNMAVETFYDFTTQNEGHSDASRNFATPSQRIPDEYQEKFNRSSNDGIFEGGSFSTNTFLTANIGLGVERYFTPRMSIFLQPTYQHQFTKGLGPQSDQINSISILTGAKVTLKKRKKSRK